MENKIAILSVVLAGGRSTRMGHDKCFLKKDGEYLIDRAIRVCSETLNVSPIQVLISGNKTGYNCIEDKIQDFGPIGGICTTMNHLLKTESPPNWLLFIPVDMPQLRSESVKILVNSLLESVILGDFDAYLFEEFELPLILRCDERVLSAVKGVLFSSHKSDRSIRQLLKLLRIYLNSNRIVESGCFINANTPEQWLECLGGIK